MVYLISPSLPAICFSMLVLAGLVSSQNPIIYFQNKICPFDFLFHLGDGVFDNGNAIRTSPFGHSLPAARSPYGKTFPGSPSGRWSDGLLDIDVPLQWEFPKLCLIWEDCADKVGNSLFLFGDVEANDITFPLIQGKSIEEVRGYIPNVTLAQINAAREVIKMGGKKIILPGNNPIGCYPLILTDLRSNDPDAYDDIGCLKKVNELVEYKNSDLKNAITKLQEEYPDIMIFYADYYDAFQQLILETISGPNVNLLLKTCCGTGGEYNFDSTKFCGTSGVAVCPDPSRYVFWDGIHLTQAANNRLSEILQVGALEKLNCTSSKDYSSI